jgi:hypothetical protein
MTRARLIPRPAELVEAVARGELTLDQARSRRRPGAKKITIPLRQLARRMERGTRHLNVVRPRTRGDCVDGPRPCPWLLCSAHLFFDVTEYGSLVVNFPDLLDDDGNVHLEAMAETCALDVADLGGISDEDVAALLNFTREAARCLEHRAFAKVRAALRGVDLELELEHGDDR